MAFIFTSYLYPSETRSHGLLLESSQILFNFKNVNMNGTNASVKSCSKEFQEAPIIVAHMFFVKNKLKRLGVGYFQCGIKLIHQMVNFFITVIF